MNDVMQLETDEKEMRREIGYEIKNQLGVRYIVDVEIVPFVFDKD